MEISIFLAKVLGLWLLIGCAVVLLKPKVVDIMIREINNSTALFYLTAFFTLIAGILIIVGHNIWSGWPIVITLIGWISFIRGLLRLFFPERIKKLLDWILEHKNYLYTSCVIGIVIGLYLLYFGFIGTH